MKWLTSCVILPLSAFLNGMAGILKGMARFVTAKFIEKYFKNGSLCAGYRTLKTKTGWFYLDQFSNIPPLMNSTLE